MKLFSTLKILLEVPRLAKQTAVCYTINQSIFICPNSNIIYKYSLT